MYGKRGIPEKQLIKQITNNHKSLEINTQKQYLDQKGINILSVGEYLSLIIIFIGILLTSLYFKSDQYQPTRIECNSSGYPCKLVPIEFPYPSEKRK